MERVRTVSSVKNSELSIGIGRKARSTQGTQRCPVTCWCGSKTVRGEKRYGTRWASSASDPKTRHKPEHGQNALSRMIDQRSRVPRKAQHRDHPQKMFAAYKVDPWWETFVLCTCKSAGAGWVDLSGVVRGAKPARYVQTSTASSILNIWYVAAAQRQGIGHILHSSKK